MTDFLLDSANEHDDDLITGLCSAARTARKELRDWVQTVLKQLILETDLQEAMEDGLLKSHIAETNKRLRTMDQSFLPEVDKRYAALIDEVQNGGYTDLFDAYDQLQQGQHALVQMMRELLQIRLSIGGMADS